MLKKLYISKKLTALLIFGRPILVFGSMLCAINVMWNQSPVLYALGIILLFLSLTFDLIDGWFASRFGPNFTLTNLADRVMDKIVYSFTFPVVAFGVIWRFHFVSANHTKIELLHSIFVLILCVTILIRDNFANFMRGFGMRKGQEPEHSEFTRLRTIVAAPVGTLLYAYAFYVPSSHESKIYDLISIIGNIPIRILFVIEILFLIINFGSIAGYCKKYGTYCLDEISNGDELLRRRILSLFPNTLTILNALMGLLAVFFAYQERIREAYLILIGAALFDKFDGALARKLGLTEPFPTQQDQDSSSSKHISIGAILDDISDAVSFCIAPAWIFYITISDCMDPVIKNLPLGIIALIYSLAGIIRLIYFTMDKTPIPGFFKGMPTPAAALLVTAPLIILDKAITNEIELVRFWGFFCSGIMIFASILMNIYPIRYLHIGRYMSRNPWFVRLNLILMMLFIFTPYFGHFSLLFMFLYVISPFITKNINTEEASKETK